MINNLPGIVYRCLDDSNWSMEYISDAILDIAGYPPSDFINNKVRDFNSIIVEEDRQKVWDDIQTALKQNRSYTLEYKIHTSSGKIKWIWERGQGLLQNDGSIVLEGYIADITEKKESEEKIIAAAKKWQTTIEAMSESVCLVDLEGHILEYNSMSLKIFGVSSKEIKMKCCWELVHGLGKPIENCPIVRMKKSKQRESMIFQDKDRWLEVRVDPIFDNQGELTGAVHVVSDITERKKAEEALIESEEKFKSLFENQLEAYAYHEIILDEKGKPSDYRFINVNGQFLLQTGLKNKNEIIGKTVLEIWPNLGKSWIDIYGEVALTGKPKTFENFSAPLNKHFLVNAYSPKQGFFATSFFDITENKKAADKLFSSREQLKLLTAHLQEVREEERRNISLEIHDDLGQQLTALKIDITWLRQILSNEDKSLIEKTESMNNIINGVIQSVQRISSSLRPSILDDLGLMPAIEWLVNDFNNYSGIKCKLTLPSDEFDFGKNEAINLFRIVQETLTNIARHSKATKASIIIKEANNNLEIKISDNGIGISKENILDANSFGLQGMKERAEVFKGKIKITGREGKGTKVEIIVPLIKQG